jgi:hypothetical protein
MGTIDRTPYNALVDDNGTGTTGSVWNKAAIKTSILDPVDAALAAAGAYPFSLGAGLFVPLAAGTYHNLAPGGATIWDLNPGGPVTITGFAAEPDGRFHFIVNSSASVITMPTKDAGSLTNNQFIGPGFGTFTLGVWKSAFVTYLGRYGAWVITGT